MKQRECLLGRHHVNLSNRDPHRTSLLKIWNSHVLGEYKLKTKTPLCQGSTNVESVTSRFKNNWSFSCFNELKQYLVMSGSCHNCFNWCYSCVISVYCVFICFGLSQVMLENGLSALHLQPQLTNQSRHVCMFLNPTCLYQMGLSMYASIHFMPSCLYHR